MDIKRLLELSGIGEVVSPQQSMYAHDESDAHIENAIRDQVTHWAEKVIDPVLSDPSSYKFSKRIPPNGIAVHFYWGVAGEGGYRNIYLYDPQDMDKTKVIGQVKDESQEQLFWKILTEVYQAGGWRVEIKPSDQGSRHATLVFKHY